MSTVDAVNKALLKSTHLNEETTIVTDSLTASVRTMEPTSTTDEPTEVAQLMAKSKSVIHISPDTFRFMKEDETDIFQTQVTQPIRLAC